MKKQLFYYSILLIVAPYLVDCMQAHSKHPDVLWIKSGIYNGGPFGIFTSIVLALIGFVIFLRLLIDKIKNK